VTCRFVDNTNGKKGAYEKSKAIRPRKTGKKRRVLIVDDHAVAAAAKVWRW